MEFRQDASIEEIMYKLESLASNDDFMQHIFNNDMRAERDSGNFLLVLPAGISGHIEAGAAHGIGKKCYAVGAVEKTETLYSIFETIFPNIEALQARLENN